MNRTQHNKYDLAVKLVNEECQKATILDAVDELVKSYESEQDKLIKKLDRWYKLLITDGVNSKGIVRNDILRYKEELTTKWNQ